MTEMLSSLKIAKNNVHVFQGKLFTCCDVRAMLETDNLPRRIVNRLYIVANRLKDPSFVSGCNILIIFLKI